MNNIKDYLKNLVSHKIFSKKITVYGWEFNFEHEIISSIFPYLFEELNIIENIALESNENRDGRIREKKYITIHDTGDTKDYRDARYWSNVVKEQKQEDLGTKYAASFQYVVGNDGIYHNIPDEEVAYHAGDTTYYDYKLYDTGVEVSNEFKLDIIDNTYYINGINTNIKPTVPEGVVVDINQINSQGILIREIDGRYFIGETYLNNTYKKIANRGGNNNSIGMEVCINRGSDIYKNWQLSAKLTALLLDQNNLQFSDVKQHHYFSGKDCPMTLRKNELWDHFMNLIKVEYDFLQFKKQGYKFELEPLTDNVLPNGRVVNLNKEPKAKLKVTLGNKTDIYEI